MKSTLGKSRGTQWRGREKRETKVIRRDKVEGGFERESMKKGRTSHFHTFMEVE